MSLGSLPYRFAPIDMLGSASRLYSDFLDAPANVAEYFGPRFDDAAALAALSIRLGTSDYPREQTADALHIFALEAGAPSVVMAQIERLRRSDSRVVFAGQQPGLFTGPLYSIYKGLTAERWAADLESQLAAPVIPCYWLAGDDHDLAEVDHIKIPSGTGLETLQLTSPAALAGVPVDRIALDDGIGALIRTLTDYLPATRSCEQALNALRDCYLPGTRFSLAFARLWYRMFPSSTLVFVAPDLKALRGAAVALLQSAVRDHARLFSLYDHASERLEAAGYHRQVRKRPTQTLLFHQRAKRTGIRRGEEPGTFIGVGDRPITEKQLCQGIQTHPDDYSPNVLLRPIVQNAMFPTVGVVLGPAEVAYYAQIGTLHDFFAVPRPAVMPRTSITVLDSRLRPIVQQIFPNGRPQERELNVIYPWSLHGSAFLDDLQRLWPVGMRRHLIWELE